jgi:polysaccharide biosynthesis/export protein
MIPQSIHFAHSGFHSIEQGRAKARLAVSCLAGFLLTSPGLLFPLLAQDVGVRPVPKARSVEDPRPAAPTEPVSAKPSSSAVLLPSDVISVSVFQEPDLEAKARLTDDGSVVLPLIGSVTLGGKTLKRATEEVTALYKKDYLVDPLVTIFVVEHEPKESKKEAAARVVVLGQVVRPGTVDIPAGKGTPIMEAIAIAGGFTRIARESKITVKRLVAGKEQVFKVNGKDQAESGNTKIFLVYPGDVISVGESWF